MCYNMNVSEIARKFTFQKGNSTLKRFLSLLMTAMLILGMATAVTAANAAPKAYASAKDGELLYHLNFNDTAVFNPKGNDDAEKYYTYSVGDNGNSLTIRGTNKDVDGYWGAPIKGLEVDANSKVTFTYKAKANGTTGKNNSIGVGGWLYNAADPSKYNADFLNNYSNHNTVNADGSDPTNREALSLGGKKQGKVAGAGTKDTEYTYVVKEAKVDADGFVSCKIEFDGPNKIFHLYLLTKDGKWTYVDNSIKMLKDDISGSLCFMVYSYYQVVNSTVKDVKFYKGIGLTDAQLNPPAKAPTTAPATADAASLAIAAMAAAAACAVVVAKKKH